jgi:hypothetical protein
MENNATRNELNDAREHVKDAVRASLMAVRNVVDFALSKLDGEDTPQEPPGKDAAQEPASTQHEP